MVVGFVGTGTIVAAMVTGLRAAGGEEPEIVLSPRSAAVAAALAAEFAGVAVAGSNQEVLDRSEVVVIAVRPQVVREVLAELRFREEHRVVSVVSLLSMEGLRERVGPAKHVVRAVPLPSAAKRRSPTVVYPPDEVAEELFGRMGAAFAVETEAEFEALCTASATMAAQFLYEAAIADWLVREGVPAAKARGYVAQILYGLAHTAVELGEQDFRSLAVDHATKGGLNEQFARHLRERGMFDAVAEGLDGVLQRYKREAR